MTGGWVRAVAALAEVLFETEEGPPPADRVTWLCGEVQDFFARVGTRSRLVFRLSLFAVGLLGPLLVLRPWPLRFIGHERRAVALSRVERSPLGGALFAVKAILCILYFEHADAAAEAGYEAECLQ